MRYIDRRLEAAGVEEEIISFNLRQALELATDVQRAYKESGAPQRRLLNQAFFKKLIVCTPEL